MDTEVMAPVSATPPRPIENSHFSWHITAPGADPMTGTTDTYALAAVYAATGSRYVHQDFWFISIPTNATRSNIQVGASIAPDQHLGGFYGAYTEISVIPVCVYQTFPPASAMLDPPGSTDHGYFTGTKSIVEGGTAFISGFPQQPALGITFQLGSAHPQSALSFAWRMTLESERKDRRGTLDDKVYPIGGGYTPFTNSPWMQIRQLMGDEIVGGKCTVFAKARNNKGKEQERKFEFFIRGMNPADALARAYIDDVVDDVFKPYAWAIFRHESRAGAYVYNQFNPYGRHKHLPNWGDKDGWGIVQIDYTSHKPKRTATTAEVYNWRTNVLSGSLTLREKLATHKDHLIKIERTYPNEWEKPPATMQLNNNDWPSEQLAVTVLYNSAKDVRPTRVILRENPRVWGQVLSPLVFDPKEQKTKRWSFSDNWTNYAYQVTREFNPNAFPPPQE